MCDTHVNEARQWYDTADISRVNELLTNAGASSIWVKRLVSNNNSKQQVYLAGDPSDLSFLPLGDPSYTPAKSQKKKAGNPVIQIPVTWQWVTPNGQFDAPDASSATTRNTLKYAFLASCAVARKHRRNC